MPNMAVSTAFKGKDLMSKKFNTMGRNAKKFGNTASKSFDKVSTSANKTSNIMKGILSAGAVTKGLDLMQEGVLGVVAGFIDFDDSIVAAGARFTDIGPSAKNFEKQLLLIKTAARNAGATTEFTAAQSAKALDFMAKAGFSSTTAMGSLRSMINLSTATGEEFARVADISSDLLGAFGLAANNIVDPVRRAEARIKNLNRLNDVLVKTTNSANVTVEDMFETMKSIGPVSGILSASLEEVSALTAVMGSSGIKGSDAMTALKNAYLRLAAPVGAGADVLRMLNITLDNGRGGAKKMTDIMSELGSKIKDMGDVPRAKILDAIFGKRAIAGSKNLMDNISTIKKFEKELVNAGGFSEKVAEIMRKSLGNRLKSLQSAAIETGFKFLSAFQGDGVDAITSLTNVIRKFDMKGVIETTRSLIEGFKKFYAVTKPIRDIMPIIIGSMIAYSATMKTIALVEAVRGMWMFVRVIRAAVVSQGLLNAVMIMNPLGATIAGVVALSAAVVLLYKNWKKIEFLRVAVDFWTDKLSSVFTDLSGALKITVDFWTNKISSVFGNISGVLGKISGVFNRNAQPERQKVIKYPVPPNRTEAEARQQSVKVNGQINVAAPAGTVVENDSSPGIDMGMLGAN